MRSDNAVNILLGSILLCFVGLGCKGLTGANTEGNPSKGNGSPAPANATTRSNADPGSRKIENPGLEKPDFTVTAEDLDKEFTREGVTDKDLAKYAKKNIAVTGRISMLVLEKKGTVQPWVTLYAPGVLHGVSCYFDDKDLDQMKLLKEDSLAKVQGFQDDFIVPKISPTLKHCAVIEAK